MYVALKRTNNMKGFCMFEKRLMRAENNNYKTANGFTLAEVLITLGIIGVVAAITLPMLIQNYQRKVVETRLAKFSSMFNQAIERSVADNGETKYWDDYQVGEKYDTIDGEKVLQDMHNESDASFNKYLGKYMNIIRKKEINVNAPYVAGSAGKKTYLYYLSDGSAFSFRYMHNREIIFYPKATDKCVAMSEYDKIGTCAFIFSFFTVNNDTSQDMKYVRGGHLDPYMYKWDGTVDNLINYSERGCNNHPSKELGAYFCTKLIEINGWKIPKDYPRKVW